MTIRLSPLVLPLNLYVFPRTGLDLSVNAVGAGSNANAGIVTTDVGAGLVAQLGPLVLPQMVRASTPAIGGVEVTITGAQALGQAEGLEGATTTIRADGAEGEAEAGFDTVFEGINALINKGAETRDFSGNEIDDRTGFKLYPGEAVKDFTGQFTREKSADPEPFRESLRYRSVKASPRTKNAELPDNFIGDIDVKIINVVSKAKAGDVSVTIGEMLFQISPLALPMMKRNTKGK